MGTNYIEYVIYRTETPALAYRWLEDMMFMY